MVAGISHSIPSKPEPTFFVRDIPIYGDTILAPMAGYSNVPYRAICRQFGSAMQYTEFVAVEMLLGRRPNHYWKLLDFKKDEYPRVMQIFGNDAGKILQAAQRIEQWGVDIIDINMGCSTKKVSGRGAGVGMMATPKLIQDTFQLLTQHLSVPVTGKIRLGWNNLQNYLEVGKILEENGASLVAIHPRTKEQKYKGEARWEAIAELKQTLTVPVIGNGDVTTPEDIARMLAYTGCDAVMIGRAAIGNPWLLAQQKREEIPFIHVAQIMRQHMKEMVNYYELSLALRLFRKYIKKYLANMPAIAHLIPPLLKMNDLSTFDNLLVQAETIMMSVRSPRYKELVHLPNYQNYKGIDY